MNWLSRAVSDLLIFLIKIYQLTLSPLLGPSCRFQPSCSRYAIACLSTHGPMRGSWLAVKRIARCHPFHPGGYDPPPAAGPDGSSSPSTSPPPPQQSDAPITETGKRDGLGG